MDSARLVALIVITVSTLVGVAIAHWGLPKLVKDRTLTREQAEQVYPIFMVLSPILGFIVGTGWIGTEVYFRVLDIRGRVQLWLAGRKLDALDKELRGMLSNREENEDDDDGPGV